MPVARLIIAAWSFFEEKSSTKSKRGITTNSDKSLRMIKDFDNSILYIFIP
jgi:hypothetical protein